MRLKELESTGKIDQYGKKEGIRLRKRIAKLEKNLSGIVNMIDLPSIVFIVDTKHEEIAVREAAKLKIPCIGIVDTNVDPDAVSLPVPGNDDAIRAVSLYCKIIADAVLEGKNLRGKEPITKVKVKPLAKKVKRITDEEAKPVVEETAEEETTEEASEQTEQVDQPIASESTSEMEPSTSTVEQTQE